MSKDERFSSPGTIWVCGACGRTKRGDRYDMGDTSCVMHAVLCKEASLVYENGRLKTCEAVDDE